MDAADEADKLIEESVNDSIRQRREAAAQMPAGNPGECELCGEWSGRLVGGACSPCRDRYKLP